MSPDAASDRERSLEREVRETARELADRYEEINLLYTISEILGSVLSLDGASERILAEVAGVLAARRASLWVYRTDDDRLHLTAAVGEEGITGPIPIDDPESVTAWVFRERQPLNVERQGALPRGVHPDLQTRSGEPFLSVPIQYTSPEGASRTVGVITLVGRHGGNRFHAGDARMLTAIASQVGAAIEVHRLLEANVERERLAREVELAHNLQLKLLPDTNRFDGIANVAARCVPAESVGGDFYHLFRLPGERLGVMIGDVSGHGFPAALIMAMAMSTAGIHAPEAASPTDTLRRVHRTLISELERTEMHVSLFYGVLDADAGRFDYTNAGHPHVFRLDGDGSVERLGATNPPLGTAPVEGYGHATVEWRGGRDLLFLFTDGLSDTLGGGHAADGPLLAGGHAGRGEEVLLEAVIEAWDGSPAEILDRVFAVVDAVDGPTLPADDRTAVLVRG